MKKIIALFVCILALSGCSTVKNEEVEKQENVQPIQSAPSPKQDVAQNDAAKSQDWKSYQNKQLGISFQYPSKIGTAWENKYKEDLFALKFLDAQGQPNGIELAPANYEKLRTCEDILSNGFNDGDRMPKDCVTLNIDNHTVVVFTYVAGGRSNSFTNASKSAQFQTNKGVWEFSTMNEGLYSDFMEIIKTLKF